VTLMGVMGFVASVLFSATHAFKRFRDIVCAVFVDHGFPRFRMAVFLGGNIIPAS
jgi:hypothetical protein